MVLQPSDCRQYRFGLDLGHARGVPALQAAEGGRENLVRSARKRAGLYRLHDAGGIGMSGNDVADVLRRRTVAFTEFDGRLETTPLIRKLTRGRFALEDYRAFLINLRQQV